MPLPAPALPPAGDGQTYKIGICQLVQHEALDAANQGFQDALTEKLGDAVKFDDQNASGDSANCSTIVNGFVSDGDDLILAIATSPCRPLLPPLPTSPCWAPPSPTMPPHWRSPIERHRGHQRLRHFRSGSAGSAGRICSTICSPTPRTVGLLYCSAEPNSVYQCTVIEGYLKELGST